MPKTADLQPIVYKDKKGRKIIIRAYGEEDFPKLKEMYDKFKPKGLEPGLPPMEDRVREQSLNSITSSFSNILAIHKGKVIGHAGLDLSDPNLCPEYLIFIKQGYRDAGIGTAMSKLMSQIAHAAGCCKVWLTVRSANTRAIRVFERIKFRFKGDIDIQRQMELIIKTTPFSDKDKRRP
ncbi:MAG: hypothetical protein DRH15_00845 [Deltaproteobacteria bacterium]|nr:MAG: hypothetical protein DRH15_00845 [Deltaproteobacteria bacterium]